MNEWITQKNIYINTFPSLTHFVCRTEERRRERGSQVKKKNARMNVQRKEDGSRDEEPFKSGVSFVARVHLVITDHNSFDSSLFNSLFASIWLLSDLSGPDYLVVCRLGMSGKRSEKGDTMIHTYYNWNHQKTSHTKHSTDSNDDDYDGEIEVTWHHIMMII